MPNRSREKGDRAERALVTLHHMAGIPAERIPLSGAMGGSFSGDLRIADTYTAEVKARKDGAGFKTLEGWLGRNDLLFLRRDRTTPIVVLSWETYIHLMKGRP